MKIRTSLSESVLYAAIEIERLAESGAFDSARLTEAADKFDEECRRVSDGQKATPGRFFIWEPWIIRAVREFRKKPRVQSEGPVIIDAYSFLERQSKRLRYIAAGGRMTPRMRAYLVAFLLSFHRFALAEEDPKRSRFAA